MKKSLIERLRAKKAARSTVFGVSWYSEDAWGRVKASATDPEWFEATYVEWLAMAKEALTDLEKVGASPIKVQLVPDEFLPWLLLHQKSNNAEARAEFVSEKVRGYTDKQSGI